jgi:hypothetical protein
MHVIIPTRLGQRFFAGMDISPGAKTYFEFLYERQQAAFGRLDAEYRLVEICKGARDRVRWLDTPALLQAIESPFPIPDRIALTNMVQVPFRTDAGTIAHFELPRSTVR